jgi:hypothetical protein
MSLFHPCRFVASGGYSGRHWKIDFEISFSITLEREKHSGAKCGDDNARNCRVLPSINIRIAWAVCCEDALVIGAKEKFLTTPNTPKPLLNAIDCVDLQ